MILDHTSILLLFTYKHTEARNLGNIFLYFQNYEQSLGKFLCK